jgi:predicted Rossmann fold flavoprotein
MSTNWDVIVVGAGAAGLLAAARAAERGRRVLLLEKNTKPGVKILMSGGTRCNLTHATDARGIVAAFGRQGSFLHSALAALAPDDVVALFQAEGLDTKVEPGGKVFPASDRALDVLRALRARLVRSGATLSLAEPVVEVTRGGDQGGFQLVTSQRTLIAGRLILTTGGQSYPGCGTKGDGYAWAASFGHTIVRPRPALVPVTSQCEWARALSGVTLPDVQVRVLEDDKLVTKSELIDPVRAVRRSALLFTHFGYSGPAVMDVSSSISSQAKPSRLVLECDFLPDVRISGLDQRLQDAAARQGKKQIAAVLSEWLPRRLIDALLAVQQVPLDRVGAELSRSDRARIATALKATRLPVTGTLGFEKAEVTAGGVKLQEVDSRTMRSKIVPGLFFAGEVLDLDGPIGGYNFQAAFSTGWLAGESV